MDELERAATDRNCLTPGTSARREFLELLFAECERMALACGMTVARNAPRYWDFCDGGATLRLRIADHPCGHGGFDMEIRTDLRPIRPQLQSLANRLTAITER